MTCGFILRRAFSGILSKYVLRSLVSCRRRKSALTIRLYSMWGMGGAGVVVEGTLGVVVCASYTTSGSHIAPLGMLLNCRLLLLYQKEECTSMYL